VFICAKELGIKFAHISYEINITGNEQTIDAATTTIIEIVLFINVLLAIKLLVNEYK
jgi:hypothetical protein